MLVVAATIAMIAWLPRLSAQANHSEGISLPTASRVHDSGWWPTKGDAAREDYVGPAECSKCHETQGTSWRETAMAHAGEGTTQSEILRRHDHLNFQAGPYEYAIVTENQKTVQEVSSGDTRRSDDLQWAFGVGNMGQTYLYQKSGVFYEGHVSFYSTPQMLDITPGQSRSVPASTDEASGRRMDADETRHCFSCHTTASITKDQFDPDRLFPGVTCEACHGPGAKHVAAVMSGDAAHIENSILNPGRLNATDAVDFCGACHRTWQDVVSNHGVGLGVFNVRFAPYRLENSRCWKDGEIACTSCHDPHKPLVQDDKSYDSNCLQCHATIKSAAKTSTHSGRACRVAAKNCVSCHMPKYSPPNLHSSFTDHWIRIVRGTSYPD
jgi:hypothetical protein